MEVSFKTDKGVMRSNNEDSCFIIPGAGVYMVADGVGGNNSGEIASRMTVTGVAEYISANSLEGVKTFRTCQTYFKDCIKKVNYKLVQRANSDEATRGMATTIVLSYFFDNKMVVMNVGDSRAYLYRNGKLKQITEDHTYVNSLKKAGLLTEDGKGVQAGKNYITRAVGADVDVSPDFFQMPVKAGDVIMLCSDGLYGETGDDAIAEELGSGKSMGEMCSDLVNMANANGGTDNITVVCLRVTEGDIDE
ncbi:MAG: Stp1/IreP family PP2C-type Ser/Thr phosphatase [Eubacteriales bacterium]|nr:Stp1/IreP family PP2C-type Ser/Thr phosphatase [Eubacteriales bacterium]